MDKSNQLHRTGKAYQTAIAYWQQALADCPGPYVFPEYRVHPDEARVNTICTLPATTVTRLSEITQGNATAELAVLLSGLSWFLWRCQQQPWVAVQVPTGLAMPLTLVQSIEPHHSPKQHVLATQERLTTALSMEIVDMADVFTGHQGSFTTVGLGSDKLAPLDDDDGHVLRVRYVNGNALSVSGKPQMLGAHFGDHLVAGICHFLAHLGDQNQTLASLPFLTAGPEMTAGPELTAGPKILTDLFAETARQYPDRLALADEGGEGSEEGDIRWTYRALDEQSNRLARHINEVYGIGPLDAVAVLMDNCADGFLALLAVLKAGGVYVPVDPSWPAARISSILAQAQVKLVLTLSGHLSAAVFELPVFAMDFQLEMLDESADALTSLAEPDGLAYILFTSGTTGVPRGVEVTHLALAAMITDQCDYFDICPGDRLAQPYALTFDASLLCALVTLLSGASVFVLAKAQLTAPGISDFFSRHQINVASFVPSVLRTLIPASLDGVKLLICGGEKVLPTDVRRYGVNKRFVNSYGTTETTCCACTGDITPAMAEQATISVGMPLKGMYIRILDPQRQIKLPGLVGEVWIGGRHLARGYLGLVGQSKQTEKVQENFIDDPFLAGAKLYKSGDLGNMTAAGALQIWGRCDRQFKFNGLRIEPLEIEALLNVHPQIKVGHVEAFTADDSSVRIVAFVVSSERSMQSAQPSSLEQSIVSFLQQQLPQYWIPQAFVWLAALPVTSHGKLDKQQLRTLWQQTETVEQTGETLTETGQQLLVHWQHLFSDKTVNGTESFYALGGHSLLAIELLATVRQLFAVDITLSAFLANPTITGLAQAIDEKGQIVSQVMCRAPVDAVITPMGSQQGFFVHNQRSVADTANHIPRCFQIQGVLDTQRFIEAVNTLSQRHEALRMIFNLTATGELVALFHQQPHWDWAGSVIGDQDVVTLIHNEHLQVFDLTQGPLLRFHYFTNDVDGVDGGYLVFTCHHIICDGWSLAIFFDELSTLYNGGSLEPLAFTLRDCLYWQHHRDDEEQQQARLLQWQQRLSGYHNHPLVALDFPRQPGLSRAGAQGTLNLMISSSIWTALKGFSSEHNVSHFTVLTAVLAKLLFIESGQTAIRLGTPVAGRQHPAMTSQMGCFLNLLVLPLNVLPQASFASVVDALSKQIIWALEHSHTEFSTLVQSLPQTSNSGRQPLFDIEIDYRARDMAADPATLALDGLQADKYDLAKTDGGKFDLDFLFTETAEGLSLSLCYDQRIYLPSTAQRLATDYLDLLATVLDEPLMNSITEADNEVVNNQPSAKQRLKDKRKNRLMAHKTDKVPVQTSPAAVVPEVRVPEFLGQSLAQRLQQDSGQITQTLAHRKVILYRGFSLCSDDDFQLAVRALADEPFDYIERSSLRQEVKQGIYTSTEHPANQEIQLHCEHSYSAQWPQRLIFCCLTPASQGGATTLSNAQQVTRVLSESVQNRFRREGILYVRNFGDKLGLNWSDAFRTDSQKVVEGYCRQHQIDYEWWGKGNLKTRAIRPAFRLHPLTGELLWFNHAYFFNPSSLDAELYHNLLQYCPAEELPFNTFYGNGEVIETKVLADIGMALQQSKINHDWQQGDFLILDNMHVAHGRKPFTGERKILLAMTQMQQDKGGQVLVDGGLGA